MGKQEGYKCDNCGKLGIDHPWHGLPKPWYQIWLSGSPTYEYTLCSKECMTAWVLGDAPVQVPERASTLFRKWLKAWLG